MNQRFHFLFANILSLLAFSSVAQKNALWVGASSGSVNPPIGSYIAGHTQNRKFSGIHDSLFTKAFLATDGKNGFAIITIDCIGLLYPQLEAIRSLVAAAIPKKDFDAGKITLSSTHTHAGPDVVGLWGPDPAHSGVDTTYINFLVKTAAEQVIKACQNKQRAIARYGSTEYGEEWVFNISQPDELDRALTTLQFLSENGQNIATLTNFACHPTFVDAVHDKVSADYVSGFYKKMDSVFGGTNIFLQGSIGGWVQPEYEAKTFEQAEFRGIELANKVNSLLEGATKLEKGTIHFSSRKFMMPVANPGFQMVSKMGVIKRAITDGTLTEIAWFSIGEAMFATHPGETVPAMSLATKKLMNTKGPKFVMGLGMDALGYILKPEFFDKEKKIPHAEYLCGMSVGIEAMPLVMKIVTELATGQ